MRALPFLLLLACGQAARPVGPAPPVCGDDAGSCLARARELASGESLDSEGAARLYAELCERDVAEACEDLADLHDVGRLRESSREQALRAADKACRLGRGSACCLAGVILSSEGDHVAARLRFTAGCEADDAVSCNNVSALCGRGLAGPVDRDCQLDFNARREHLLADRCGQQHLPRECELVGQSLLAEGRVAEALEPLELACEQHDDRACRYLGTALVVGAEGVAVDVPRALAVLLSGCQHGGAESCSRLAGLRLEQGDRAGAMTVAVRACELGSGEGCYLGAVLKPDAARAGFERACALRYAGGCAGVGLLAMQARRPELARPAFEQACDLEMMCASADPTCNDLAAASCNSAGRMLEDGVGGPADPAAAARRFDRACRLGLSQACP